MAHCANVLLKRIAKTNGWPISAETPTEEALGAIKSIAPVLAAARGNVMLILVKSAPREIRRDIVVACLRACVWARVEGRPFCLVGP
jgi:hypothetical protein